MMKHDYKAVSDVLEGVVNDHIHDTISIGEIKAVLHERGFGILLMIFSLPMAIPILPPGFALLPGLPITFFAVQMMFGQDVPWLPKWIERQKIKRKTLAKIVEIAAPKLRKIESFLRVRFAIASSKKGERLIGLICLFCAISIIIPLPATNMVPALGISLMSLGLLSKDGIFICIGMLVGLIGSIFGFLITIVFIVAGMSGVSKIIHTFL